jgi:hypothetical protein
MTGSLLLRRAARIAWLVALVGFAAGSQRVLAADPSATPSATPPPCPDQYIAWFDAPLPPDVPVGRQIQIGVTVWDCNGNGLARAESAEIRVHPGSGKAEPTVFPSRSDWPGHVVSTIEVPKGGLGTIDVGVRGQECHDDGTCKDAFFAFATGGFGPPTDAPLAVLVDARVMPQPEPIVAGHTFEVDVALEPRAEWDPAIVLPDRIVIAAAVVRGGSEYRTDALRAPGSDAPYSARLTVPEAGDYVLHAGFPGNGAPDQMIDGADARITIEPGDGTTDSPSPAAAAVTSGSDGAALPLLPIAGVLALGVLAVVVQRVFADL